MSSPDKMNSKAKEYGKGLFVIVQMEQWTLV